MEVVKGGAWAEWVGRWLGEGRRAGDGRRVKEAGWECGTRRESRGWHRGGAGRVNFRVTPK